MQTFIHECGRFAESALGLGVEPKHLTLINMVLRGFIVFFAALVMVRTGDKRFFARKSAFDVILGFVLASVLSRGINGSAPLFQTIGAGFALVWLHRFLAACARRWHPFGHLIKGGSDIVIKDGQLMQDAMRKNNLTERDVLEDLRLNGALTDPAEVEEARIERNGDLSVIKKRS
ncbi:MAG: DUF421 domain-containing protein [Chthoniobacterales bacterium]